ncbi:MAG TPA: hypothetical protein EYQ21_04720 [Flavobacteriales bacterium]|nr:hypothetical protein [Flavobacteriales bacterium]
MHATFVFLIDGIEGKSDSSDMKEVIDEVVTTFESRYGYVCDENNWWQPEAVLFQDGTVVNACLGEENDWRGRDKFADHVMEKCPEDSERWKWGKEFAMQCTALELELYGSDSFGLASKGSERAEKKKTVGELSYDELIDAVGREVPNALSKMYATVSAGDVSMQGQISAGEESGKLGDVRMSNYKRSKISSTFELFVESDIKPFTRYTESPNKYRCFDLRHDSYGIDVTDDTVMLFVDIHT